MAMISPKRVWRSGFVNAPRPWFKAALLLAVVAIGVVLRVHDYATGKTIRRCRR